MTGAYLERTSAARRFRERTGYANHRLNTIIVGLEAVKHGVAKKPHDLAVRWEPKDVKAASDQARSYATNAIMVYVVDSLDTYMVNIASQEPWIRDSVKKSILLGEYQPDKSDTSTLSMDILKKFAKDICDQNTSSENLEKQFRQFLNTYFGRSKKPSLPFRFLNLSLREDQIPPQYSAAVELLISWRNRHVHGRSSRIISQKTLSKITDYSEYFDKNHRHLDVHKMIDNYSSGGSPTLKEISSLISVLHRVVTKVDSDIVSAADPETAFIEALKDGLSNSGNPKERIKEYWGKSLAVRASKLISMSSNYGFRKATDPDHAKKSLYLQEESVFKIAKHERDYFTSTILG